MRAAPGLLLLFAALPAFAAPASEGVASPRTLAEFERKIAESEEALSRLVLRAHVDFKVERIRLYRAMSPQQLADPLRGVTVDELLRYVADETAPADVRDEGALAIASDLAQRVDPDLSEDGKGVKRPKVIFSQKVLPMLQAKDIHSRGIAKTMLEALWPGMAAREPSIAGYDPRKKDTWGEARRGWDKQFRR